MNSLDLATYQRPTGAKSASPVANYLPRHRTGEWFIRGPIPGWWLGAAAKLPGRTLHVAMAIWLEVSLAKKPRAILRNKTLKHFGVSRKAAYASLKRLENAGLIRVDRHNGRLPRVTICDREATKT